LEDVFAVLCQTGAVEQFEGRGVGVTDLDGFAREGVELVDLTVPDVIADAVEQEIGRPVSAAPQQDYRKNEAQRGGRLSQHFRCAFSVWGHIEPPGNLVRDYPSADISSARRTQYRLRGMLAPRVECRIRESGDWGVVKHRDVSAIDRQLSLLAAVSSSIRRLGGKPSTALIDELLDERIASKPLPLLAPAGCGDGNGNPDQRDDGSQN
jgi:hypothetical protein